MKCSEFEKFLPEFADRTLGAGQQRDMETHAAECPACRANLAEIQGVMSSLAKAVPDDPGELFWKRFNNSIYGRLEKPAARPAPARNIFSIPALRRGAAGLLVAASLLVAFILVSNFTRTGNNSEPATMAKIPTVQSTTVLPKEPSVAPKVATAVPPASNNTSTPVAMNPIQNARPVAVAAVAKRKPIISNKYKATMPAPATPAAPSGQEEDILLAAAATDSQIPHFSSLKSARQSYTLDTVNIEIADINSLAPSAKLTDVSGNYEVPGAIMEMTDEEAQRILDSLPPMDGPKQTFNTEPTRWAA